MKDEAILAVKGLPGWYVYGRSSPNCTYHAGPYQTQPAAQFAVDMVPVLESQELSQAVISIWRRPNLDLMLPDNNVRNLFEGCIGCEGKTSGHPWNGNLASLHSTDSVGITVYLKILESQGGISLK
jgi:hypothetical protein